MNRIITIEDVRECLVNQIADKITESYGFDESEVMVTLNGGQMIPCYAVERKEFDNGKVSLIFSLSIVGVQDIEVSHYDITIESLDKILKAIKVNSHTLYIWGCEDTDKGSNQIILFSNDNCREITDDDERIDCIREIFPLYWEKVDKGVYRAYPDHNHHNRYLTACFDC